jgi:hypothetical protein
MAALVRGRAVSVEVRMGRVSASGPRGVVLAYSVGAQTAA